ncbi:MAG: hypothetical protein EBU70_14705, partial [Actinobacteria bacterium]|nr:hypothetical protein [Actinomycetota bacterium]
MGIRPRNRVRRARSTTIFAAFARAILSVAGSVSASGIVAADPETIVDRLASPVRGTWRRSTIADVAAQLARDGGVPVAIDRRIDFTRTIDLDGDARSLAAVLDELADRVGGAAVVHGACVRIAPLDAASGAIASGTSRGRRLAAVPKTVRDALAIEAPLVVEAGERPREIVERLLAGAVLEADGLDLIPDDHLPAATYPPMPLADRLDTVLAHYDLALAADREGGTRAVEVEAIRDAGHRGGDPPKLASLA